MDTFTHHSLVTDIGDHLRRLVQVVVPFKHLFRENELQCQFYPADFLYLITPP